MSIFRGVGDFFEDLERRFRGENEERRREDRDLDLDEENEIATTPEDASSSVLPKILKVDLLSKENALNHHCESYELVTRGKGTAIVRRGGSFIIEFKLNQEVDLKKKHLLKVFLNFGPRPLVNKGTQGILEVTGKKLFDQPYEEWDHRVVTQEGDTARVEINIPHDVPVGIWDLAFELRDRDDDDPLRRHAFRSDALLYILFNPWFKHDDVYMAEEEKRQEYVLNDVGKIWVGGYPTATGRQWVFGQFDDAVLPACVLLLEKSGLRPEQRGDPILVSRAISKMVNSNDDTGVIHGRWDGKYSDGTAPAAWTGSIKIMEEYLRSGKGVKYGQCWVFSGVTTTVCRCLGIPCRSVSNMNSAHDTNMSLTIDKYFDKDGEEFKPGYDDENPSGIDDSIWNFHVWNDAWMARPDLPSGFGGWQAIDATPQESSDGIFQCGPASLEAVRKGQTNLKYDVNFVLGEVNADLVHWQRDESTKDGFKKLSSNKTYIGRQLLTKQVGKMSDENFFTSDREDCTSDYKPKEGTRAERVVLHSAVRKTRAARHAFRFPSIAEEDIEFVLEDVERVQIGNDFAISVKVKNTTDKNRTVAMVLCASSEYYTGVKAEVIKKAEGKFSLKPDENQTLRLTVTFQDYYDKLVEYAMIKLSAIANVVETTQTWINEDTFQVIKPSIKVETAGERTIGKPLLVTFSFKNPLDIALRKCVLVVDGPGLTRPKTIPVNDVEPSGTMEHRMKVYPKRTGSRSLVVTFNSKQLINITGSISIDIV